MNVPYADNFLKAATTINQTEAMKYLLEYQAKYKPTKTVRYHAIFDVGQHASKKRFFIFDGLTGTVQPYHAAHGSGSEGTKNDGWATEFSNTPESKMTSLGMYQCAEKYVGKHGISMKLDGLQSTNSNARKRAIVVHGASYVTESGAEVGDSWGCPALSMNIITTTVANLKQSSYLYVYTNNMPKK